MQLKLSFIFKKYIGIFFIFYTFLLPYCLFAFDIEYSELIQSVTENIDDENYEEALDLLINVEKEFNRTSEFFYYLALAYKYTGNYKQAEKYFKEAIDKAKPYLEAYPELINILYRFGDYNDAYNVLKVAEKEESLNQGNIAFLKGLILFELGYNKDSIDSFKKAKRIDSYLSQSSDFQIAIVYREERRFKKADQYLNSVIEFDPESNMASFAKESKRYQKEKIDSYEAWLFAAGVSYQYDDNVNLNPSKMMGTQGEVGSGAVNTLKISYNPILKGPYTFTSEYRLYSSSYFNNKDYNLLSNSVLLNPVYKLRKNFISLPFNYVYVFFRGEGYMKLYSIKPSFNFKLKEDHFPRFSLGYSNRNIIQEVSLEEEKRDSGIYSISGGYTYQFLKDKGVLNLKYDFSIDMAKGDNWKNRGNSFYLSAYWNFMKSVSFFSLFEMSLYNYWKNENNRSDKIYAGSNSIIIGFFKGLDFFLRHSFTIAESSTTLYDYRKNVYNLGLEYIF